MNLNPSALEELLIWQAFDLARRRKYSEAEALLSLLESSEGPNQSVAYGLKSRIYARQGKYAEAKTLLQKLVALDPGNAEYRNALEGLPRLQRNRRALWVGKIVVPFALAIVGISLFLWKKPFLHEGIPIPDHRETSTSSDRPADIDRASRISPFSRTALWPDIDINGVSAVKDGSEMRIIFHQGLYVEGCDLSQTGRSILMAVAESIKRFTGSLIIIIEGHTDNLAVRPCSLFRDNRDLGLKRAETVLNLFISECGVSESKLLAVSAGETTPPFSNEGNSWAKNRTVIIRILATRSD